MKQVHCINICLKFLTQVLAELLFKTHAVPVRWKVLGMCKKNWSDFPEKIWWSKKSSNLLYSLFGSPANARKLSGFVSEKMISAWKDSSQSLHGMPAHRP